MTTKLPPLPRFEKKVFRSISPSKHATPIRIRRGSNAAGHDNLQPNMEGSPKDFLNNLSLYHKPWNQDSEQNLNHVYDIKGRLASIREKIAKGSDSKERKKNGHNSKNMIRRLPSHSVNPTVDQTMVATSILTANPWRERKAPVNVHIKLDDILKMNQSFLAKTYKYDTDTPRTSQGITHPSDYSGLLNQDFDNYDPVENVKMAESPITKEYMQALLKKLYKSRSRNQTHDSSALGSNNARSYNKEGSPYLTIESHAYVGYNLDERSSIHPRSARSATLETDPTTFLLTQ
jgi:hypothetical protein